MDGVKFLIPWQKEDEYVIKICLALVLLLGWRITTLPLV